MKLVPALEYEKLRTEKESWCKMMLHKDGKFYHVYEWSAWLLKMFVCTEELQVQRGDNKILQVMRTDNPMAVYRSVNSLLGILAHYESYNIRSEIFCREKLLSISTYNSNITKMNKPCFIQTL